jgi:hypothetical protein
MRNRYARTTLATALLLAAGAAASGSVDYRNAKWTVADAIAYADDEEIEIAFTSVALDRAKMTADGTIDSLDLMRAGGNKITINLDADGPTMCIDFTSRAGDTMSSGSSCDSGMQEAITLTARSAERVAGSMQWGEKDGEHIHLSFDLPIEGGAGGGGQVARAGEPLPADGGEPGKAVLAHFAALASGDWNRLKAGAHPDRRGMMEESEKAGEHLPMFEMLQAFAPKDIRITGGTVDGDNAVIDYDATEDGRAVKGQAEVVRFEGKWYLVGTTTKD